MKIKYLYRREDQSIRHVETVSDWEFGFFRDCNGESNGKSLDIDTIIRELEAPDFVGRPAGLIGPRIKLR